MVTHEGHPYLSVVIPAYREEQRLGATLEDISRFFEKNNVSYELLVVDDGSPDGTAALVRQACARNPHIRLISHPKNRGKGAAVQTGMREARGTYALFADADNATPIGELPKLLWQAEQGHDVVIGSRYLPGSNLAKKQPPLRRLMSRAGNLLFRVLLGLRLTDTRCGFKLFNEQARHILFAHQTLERWGFDTEILVIAQRNHLSVQEVPVTWYDRERGNIHPVRDSLRSLQEILHIRRMVKRGHYDSSQSHGNKPNI